MSASPTARSLALLRAEGWLAEVVEQNVPHARTKRDLFGFIDIMAVQGDRTLAVQTTADNGGHVANRLHKIRTSPHLDAVLAAGWQVVVHGWKPDGRLRLVEVTAA